MKKFRKILGLGKVLFFSGLLTLNGCRTATTKNAQRIYDYGLERKTEKIGGLRTGLFGQLEQLASTPVGIRTLLDEGEKYDKSRLSVNGYLREKIEVDDDDKIFRFRLYERAKPETEVPNKSKEKLGELNLNIGYRSMKALSVSGTEYKEALIYLNENGKSAETTLTDMVELRIGNPQEIEGELYLKVNIKTGETEIKIDKQPVKEETEFKEGYYPYEDKDFVSCVFQAQGDESFEKLRNHSTMINSGIETNFPPELTIGGKYYEKLTIQGFERKKIVIPSWIKLSQKKEGEERVELRFYLDTSERFIDRAKKQKEKYMN